MDTPPHCFSPFFKLKRPKIGLALSGGGARGLAQIGVLQIFEDYNIPVDFIVGVSMGAVVGGLYASGYSAMELEQIMYDIPWDDIIIDRPPRSTLFLGQKEERDRPIIQIRLNNFKPVIPRAFTAGQKFSSMLNDLTMRVPYQSNSDFDKLKIPFRALACDLITGNKVLIANGNLAEAMKASATFPLLFSPVQRDNMLLVDGGLINNLPVDEVEESSDVDIIVAVNTISQLHDQEVLRNPWKIADQVTSIMQQEKSKMQCEKADLLIQMNMEGRTSDNFLHLDSLILEGRRETLSKLPALIAMIEDLHVPDIPNQPLGIQQIRFVEESPYTSPINLDSIQLVSHVPLWSERDIYLHLEEIYQIGIYRDVYGAISNDTLIIHTQLHHPFSTIKLFGNSALSDSLLLAQVKSPFNQPINYYQSQKDLKAIVDAYRQHGFSIAHIKNTILKNDTLNIYIDEGVISEIRVSGNEQTKPYVITREFPLQAGDRFNINKATAGIRNIHSTDLFTNVWFEIENTDRLIVHIKVIEKAFTVLRLSSRYDLDQKEKGFMEWVDENTLGTGDKLALYGLYGLRHKAAQLKFRSDRIFKTYLTSELTLAHQRDRTYTYHNGNRIGEYRLHRSNFSLAVGQQLQRLGNLSVIARLSQANLIGISGIGYPIEKLELQTLALRSIVDTQDRYPFPTKGKYYHFFYELSSATFLNSQVSFFKIYSTLESYVTFLERNTLHPKFSWGTSDLTTPFSEQFRIGGMNSFYGMYDDELIGRHFLLSSLEYRYFFPFRIAVDFFLSLRYDAGAAWINATDFQLTDINQGIGAALSMTSPIGPVSVAFGRSSFRHNRFYFSLGHEF
ncbi:BamA/TamA family outer membrane protein [candidate division KSB1 bacterium]|nr:BamA/TamA family outer membrane protein [candidate division KSB1 bacterium]